MIRLALKSKQIILKKLAASDGYRGKLNKLRRGGKSTGGTGIPAQIRMGKTTPHPEGFDTRYESIELTVYHAGSKRQRPRPIIGLNTKDRTKFAKLVGEAIAKLGKKAGVFK